MSAVVSQGAVSPPKKKRARVSSLVVIALVWIFGMIAVALLAEVIRPYGITALDLRARLTPPVGFGGDLRHLLGTDELGRDVLSRLIVSIRISLMIAMGATVIAAVLGTTLVFLAALGVAAAMVGGARPWRPAARVVFWGAFAMAVTTGVGMLF